MSHHSFAAAQDFTDDLLPKKDIPVNSIFDPAIYTLYTQDVKGF